LLLVQATNCFQFFNCIARFLYVITACYKNVLGVKREFDIFDGRNVTQNVGWPSNQWNFDKKWYADCKD